MSNIKDVKHSENFKAIKFTGENFSEVIDFVRSQIELTDLLVNFGTDYPFINFNSGGEFADDGYLVPSHHWVFIKEGEITIYSDRDFTACYGENIVKENK